MSEARKEKLYTIDYIESLPEGVRAELIDGRVYNMATPSDRHQAILARMSYKIQFHIEQNNGKCEVRFAPYSVYLFDDKYTHVEPDLCVICDPTKIDNKGCHGAPDWIIEVVSPSSKWIDTVLKLEKYRQAGVREYWIVDEGNKKVLVNGFELNKVEEYSLEGEIPVGIWPGFSLKL